MCNVYIENSTYQFSRESKGGGGESNSPSPGPYGILRGDFSYHFKKARENEKDTLVYVIKAEM